MMARKRKVEIPDEPIMARLDIFTPEERKKLEDDFNRAQKTMTLVPRDAILPTKTPDEIVTEEFNREYGRLPRNNNIPEILLAILKELVIARLQREKRI